RPAVHRAAAGRPRRLPARGLLQLPLADDPAVPRRDPALRPLLGRRGIRLRPPLPVGQQANRPGPAPRGRQIQRRVASHPPGQPARRGARIEHAGLSLAGEEPRRRGQHCHPHEGLARRGRALHRCRDRQGRGRPQGQDRDGRADRLPAGNGAGPQV
ncbi:MAG: Cytochrome C oxidase, mono-heme subunit/FixO, partial [uncultured Ramlibacter sp.]